MADTTHYVRARKALEGLPGGKDSAALDASLAVSTATREVTAAIIAQTRAVETKLHDIASALEPDAGLVRFQSPSGNADVWISPSHVVAVGQGVNTSNEATVFTSLAAAPMLVQGSPADVAAKLGVSA
ncbi:hypothetical protein [Nakamurella lactea]|uniref:hypothetical protein n=1 Tax=Nakamurella lactea TaxID=459515 RepID=UPI00048E285B|nr:hypothetical protein [Nakamurella lactea]